MAKLFAWKRVCVCVCVCMRLCVSVCVQSGPSSPHPPLLWWGRDYSLLPPLSLLYLECFSEIRVLSLLLVCGPDLHRLRLHLSLSFLSLHFFSFSHLSNPPPFANRKKCMDSFSRQPPGRVNKHQPGGGGAPAFWWLCDLYKVTSRL